ncbi:hypothetical protein [Pedobacter aquatilis]|uniref:hypothetical protein n=1 Tax=Pedobacter aquatilis TaxID=351343 RepID=UPI00292FF06F|nr:hypothetical protein [Pedobacter aquatilis]
MNPNKPILVSDVIIFAICICIIFPYEYNRASYITDLKFTIISLALTMFTLMYGLMGRHFFKGVLFLIFSAVFSFLCWFGVAYNDFWGIVPALYAGAPAGVLAGLLFLIFNFKFIKDENKYKLFFKRFALYLLILFVVSILFAKGGDWIFDLEMYFRSRKN